VHCDCYANVPAQLVPCINMLPADVLLSLLLLLLLLLLFAAS
jgi:hypothetical protein